MFGQPSHSARRTEANEPLLAARDSLEDDHVILGSDDDDESTALSHADDRREHVRFEEHVQVIGPPLRSMIASRETGQYVFQALKSVMSIHFLRIRAGYR